MINDLSDRLHELQPEREMKLPDVDSIVQRAQRRTRATRLYVTLSAVAVLAIGAGVAATLFGSSSRSTDGVASSPSTQTKYSVVAPVLVFGPAATACYSLPTSLPLRTCAGVSVSGFDASAGIRRNGNV